MKCCASCIGDRGLRKHIFPTITVEIGRCSYCLSDEVLVVDPAKLSDVFGPIINIYERSASGKTLVQLLKEDWGMFDHERMDEYRSKDLLAEILNDGQLVRQPFIPSPAFETDRLIKWEELRDELMFGNRFFPEVEIDRERLAALLKYLVLDDDDLPLIWHRARMLNREEAFALADMGAPPQRLATHGRANPAGIPYLYLASNASTAIAEIRPHTGERACVAEFAIPRGLKIVDLRNPRKVVSPFVLGDEEQIGFLRGDIGFLSRLGDELTRPVLPHAAAIDYVPSQYLCEFIKKCGYDGVLYRSSVGDGINVALFLPSRATANSVTIKIVSRVQVEIVDT